MDEILHTCGSIDVESVSESELSVGVVSGDKHSSVAGHEDGVRRSSRDGRDVRKRGNESGSGARENISKTKLSVVVASHCKDLSAVIEHQDVIGSRAEGLDGAGAPDDGNDTVLRAANLSVGGQEEGRGAREGGIDDGGALKIGLEGRRDGTRRKTETELAV